MGTTVGCYHGLDWDIMSFIVPYGGQIFSEVRVHYVA